MVIDKNIFNDLIENPQNAVEYIDDLKELMDNYPWFEHARTLYTKALKQSENVNFEEELMLTAVYSGNREKLYEVVMEDVGVEQKSTISKKSDQIISSEKVTPVKKKEDFSPLSKDHQPDILEEVIDEIIGNKNDLNSIIDTPTDESKFVEKESPIINESESFTEHEIPIPDDNDILEKQIITNAVSKVIEKEVYDSNFKLKGEITKEEEKERDDEINTSDVEVNYSSYTLWLLKRSKEMHYDVHLSQEDGKDEQSTNGPFELNTDQPIVSDKKQRLQWVDEFISKDPKITRGRIGEFEIHDQAKDSLRSSEDFITETMALIYIKQGKINKAKQAYRLLSVKYPEKSIYFAARIKELDKKI